MINLERNTSNVFALTIDELLKDNNTTYHFRFINEMTKAVVTFVLTDTSLFPERYNKFVLTSEQTDELIGNGFYQYEVRKEGGAKLLERGLAFLTENENNDAFYNANYINNEYGN
jgi:hypothetical protein